MAEVWLATDLRDGGRVAVKLPFRQAPVGQSSLLELRVSGMQRHPNVASLLDHGRTPDGREFVVLRWIAGNDLADCLANGPLHWRAAVWMACHVARALAHVHGHGVVHRDLRLENVRLEMNGPQALRAVLIDFGVASFHRDVATPVAPVGSMRTCSPEVAAGGVAVPESDLYGLGCLLWWLITGQPLFDGDPGEILRRHREAPAPRLPAEVPEAVANLVASLLEKSPALRPGSATNVARALELAWTQAPPLEGTVAAGATLATLAPDDHAQAELTFAGTAVFGREDVQAQLHSLLTDAAHGQPQAIVLRGVAGSGRSHLLRWLATEVDAMPAVRLQVGPDVLRRHAAAYAELPARQGLLARDVEESRCAAVTRQAEAVLADLAALPTVWLLDDAHTLVGDEVAVLLEVMHTAVHRRAPVGILLGWLESPESPVPARLTEMIGYEAVTEIALRPLSATACQQWLADGRSLDDKLLNQWVQLSAGHPRTLVQLFLAHIREGRVQARSGSWQGVAPLELSRSAAETLNSLLRAQVDDLLRQAGEGREALRLLLHAAALARSPLRLGWLPEICAQAAMPMPRMQAVLPLAATAGVLVQQGPAGALVFEHAQFAQAVRQRFRDDTRTLHQWLAVVLRDHGEPQRAWIGHLWRADALDQAWTATRSAVEDAWAIPDFAAVEALLADAEQYGQMSGALGLEDHAWMLYRYAEALVHTGNTQAASQRMVELRTLDELVDADDGASLWTRQAWLGSAAAAEGRGEHPQALEFCRIGLARKGLDKKTTARLHLIVGAASRNACDNVRAIESLRQAEALFALLGDRFGRDWARVDLALLHVMRGDLVQAESWLRPIAGDGVADVLLSARRDYVDGLRLQATGEHEASLVVLERARATLQRIGHRRGEGAALIGKAIAWRYLRAFESAECAFRTALALSEEPREDANIASTLNNLADLYVTMRRPLDALKPARRAVHLASAAQAVGHHLVALCTLAEALSALGDHAAAVQAARASLALNGEPPARLMSARLCTDLIALAAAAGFDANAVLASTEVPA